MIYPPIRRLIFVLAIVLKPCKTCEISFLAVVKSRSYLSIQVDRDTYSLQVCWCSFLHVNKAKFHTHLHPSHTETHSIQVHSYKWIFRKGKNGYVNGSKNETYCNILKPYVSLDAKLVSLILIHIKIINRVFSFPCFWSKEGDLLFVKLIEKMAQ